MPASPNEGAWFNPKWLVIGMALATFALIVSYDLQLGLAAGAFLAVIAAVWFYIALRYGSLSGGGSSSGRDTLVEGIQQQTSNRRIAVLRAAEGATDQAAERATALALGAQQRAEPAQRP